LRRRVLKRAAVALRRDAMQLRICIQRLQIRTSAEKACFLQVRSMLSPRRRKIPAAEKSMLFAIRKLQLSFKSVLPYFPHVMSHEDFLEGFGDAMGITDPDELQTHYETWLRESGMTDVERIDLEGTGYQTGLEAGHQYKQQIANENS
jgi:hypothetical protein